MFLVLKHACTGASAFRAGSMDAATVVGGIQSHLLSHLDFKLRRWPLSIHLLFISACKASTWVHTYLPPVPLYIYPGSGGRTRPRSPRVGSSRRPSKEQAKPHHRQNRGSAAPSAKGHTRAVDLAMPRSAGILSNSAIQYLLRSTAKICSNSAQNLRCCCIQVDGVERRDCRHATARCRDTKAP